MLSKYNIQTEVENGSCASGHDITTEGIQKYNYKQA